jgi:hypothetical protein
MKSIFTGLLLASAISASAQIVSVGVQGGIVNNTPHFAMYDMFTNANGRSGSIIGAKAALELVGFQIGVGIQSGATGYKYESSVILNDKGVGSYANAYEYRGKFSLPYAFVNRKFYVADESFLYLGVNAGYINYRKETFTQSKSYASGAESVISTTPLPKGSMPGGVAAGLQAGVNLNLILGFSIQAEAAARYIPIQMQYNDVSTVGAFMPHKEKNTFYLQIPLTLGLNYRF